jgi:4-amino-4-deoxy-L-arabinose transferase-like glycosyltransferase
MQRQARDAEPPMRDLERPHREILQAPAAPTIPANEGRLFLWAVIAIGLVVRLAILWSTPTLGTGIADEQQYSQIGASIVAGDGFARAPGQPTSLRPPLYPALLAAIWSVGGTRNLQFVRAFQILLALATTAVVYLLGARMYNEKIGRYAAAASWLYPSLVFFNFLILTETLFTFLLLAFVLLAVCLVQSPRASVALLCGIVLGLAALTRSVLWPLPLVLCPLLVVLIPGPLGRRIALPLVVFAGYAIVVAPWAVRNTRLQGGFTVVDTMGGMNLRMGNYEYTPDNRMWDAVALRGPQSWVRGVTPDEPGGVITEGRKDKWAQREALEYMRQHPGVTVRRAFIKFADFWGIEREFVAGVQYGLFKPPRWFQILGSGSIVAAWLAVSLLGGAGLWLTPPADRRLHVLALLPFVVIVGAHTIVFGHSRYHLPLVPILALYAGALLAAIVPSIRSARPARLTGAVVSVAALLTIWIRQVALVDAHYIQEVLHHLQ